MSHSFLWSLLFLGGVYFLSGRLIRALSRLVYFFTHSNRAVVSALAFFLLPGTFLHEVGHLIVAEFMGVRTDDLNLLPEVKEDGSIKLGGVKIVPTDPLRRTLIGLAPVFGGIILIWVSSYLVTLTTGFWWLVAYAYLLLQVSLTMFSSRKDLEGAAVGLGLILLLFLGIKYLNEVLNFAFLNNPKELLFRFLDQYSIYFQRGLLFAIGLNLGLLIILNLVFQLGRRFRERS